MYYILKTDGSLSGISSSFSEGENYTTITPPDNVDNPKFINGAWVDYAVLPMVSPVEFKMLFTSQERIAIKASPNAVVQDFFEIINDPRLTYVDRNLQSVKEAVNYLESETLIGIGRAVEILS